MFKRDGQNEHGETDTASYGETDKTRHSSPADESDEDYTHHSLQGPVVHEPSPPSASQSHPVQPKATPMQKRRRVTRACDECRRKKIKCCGRSPCTHCTVYSYDCTYDQPSMRRRNPAPQYIEALEHRLQRAEALLRTFLPNIDLNDPNLDASFAAQLPVPSNQPSLAPTPARRQQSPNAEAIIEEREEAKLQSMIESTGQLDIDDRGHWDFHGGSSGAVFLRRMREQFPGLLGEPGTPGFLPRPPMPLGMAANYDSPNSYESPIEPGIPNTADLPSRETARILCTNAINCACAILRLLHVPSFWTSFDKMYDTQPEDFGDEENRFLPLLYVVCATGCMFTELPEEVDRLEWIAYKVGIDRGLKYFRAARQMMDITDCRDLVSLQAILFMIMFLQSSANLSTCYSYIGIALRSALRMGLHRKNLGNFNPIERETRKRVFWTIRKMDTYVSALLGFPRLLSDDDIDQDPPIEVDDEYITKEAILPMPEGKISLYAASNAHTRLMGILSKVIKYIYPTKRLNESIRRGPSHGSCYYAISHARIREVESDLQEWLEKLPMSLKPGGDVSPEVLRVQQLLRMAYAHVQMMLYRPFLHYVSQKSCSGKNIDERSYACAAACVSVSRNIIHITTEMKRRGLLIGAYWFAMYTTFFGVFSLVFFVLENPDKLGSKEILADATAGRNAIGGLAKRSLAADRCSNALEPLFEKLPQRLKKGRTEIVPTQKKRRAPSETQIGLRLGIESSPDLGMFSNNSPDQKLPRATTFPTTMGTNYQATVSDPNLHQSYLGSRNEISSAGGTPESSSTTNSIQAGNSNYQAPTRQPQQQGQQVIPDLTAMMFPSTDPFAYPNQVMMEFDNIQQKREVVDDMMDGGSIQTMFMMGGTGNNDMSNTAPFDNLEGQLFGPLPAYLLQTPTTNDNMRSTPGDLDFSTLNGFSNPGLDIAGQSNHSGLTPNGNGAVVGGGMNFDEIFGNEGWEGDFRPGT